MLKQIASIYLNAEKFLCKNINSIKQFKVTLKSFSVFLNSGFSAKLHESHPFDPSIPMSLKSQKSACVF